MLWVSLESLQYGALLLHRLRKKDPYSRVVMVIPTVDVRVRYGREDLTTTVRVQGLMP